jgi:hypothetical protein
MAFFLDIVIDTYEISEDRTVGTLEISDDLTPVRNLVLPVDSQSFDLI